MVVESQAAQYLSGIVQAVLLTIVIFMPALHFARPGAKEVRVMQAAGRARLVRVLHVTPYFAPAFCYGGPPRTILGLCQAERRLGIDVTVFTTTAGREGIAASCR